MTQPGPAGAVILDLDGTLADSEQHSAAAWDTVLGGLGMVRTTADDRAVTGLSFPATRDHFARRAPALPAAGELWVPYSAALLSFLAAGVRPFPDAMALVRHLRRHAVAMAVASSSPRVRVTATLEGIGLSWLVALSVAGDEVARAKPAPDAYAAAAALLGQPAARCVAVEDSRPGVRAAVAAGMQVVAVRRAPGVDLGEATLVVDRLAATTLDPFLALGSARG